MENKPIRITEAQLRGIINKMVAETKQRLMNGRAKRPITEAVSYSQRIQAAIDKANQAYNAAKAESTDDKILLDKDGESYGLTQPIRLDGRGYVRIPFTSSYGSYEPMKVKVLTVRAGREVILKGDMYTEGWNDVAKILRNIEKDAQRGLMMFHEYDPNWEDSENPNPNAARELNKKAGLPSDYNL